MVDTVSIDSGQFANTTQILNQATSSNASGTDSTIEPVNVAYFNPIPVKQDIKLDIKVKVKDAWWKKPNGTKIKVKLSINNKGQKQSNQYQVMTIVKQSEQWVTFKGRAHAYGNKRYLVDGNIVAFNQCTGGVLTIPPGAEVEVIGLPQPDGTFTTININVINIAIINPSLSSGAPAPGSGSDGESNDGEDGGGSGGSSGGGGSNDDDD